MSPKVPPLTMPKNLSLPTSIRTLAPLPLLLQQAGDQPRPPRLVACAQAGGVVAVEVFVEGNVIAPRRITLERFLRSEDRSPPVVIPQEDVDETLRKLIRNIS